MTKSLADTASNDVPMTSRTEPVTTGGKKRSTLPKTGAAKKVKMPATIMAP